MQYRITHNHIFFIGKMKELPLFLQSLASNNNINQSDFLHTKPAKENLLLTTCIQNYLQ